MMPLPHGSPSGPSYLTVANRVVVSCQSSQGALLRIVLNPLRWNWRPSDVRIGIS